MTMASWKRRACSSAPPALRCSVAARRSSRESAFPPQSGAIPSPKSAATGTAAPPRPRKTGPYVFNDLLGEAYPGLKAKVTASGLGGNVVFDCLTRSGVPDPYPQAELCLLQFGTNDAMFEPPARFAEGLRLLIKQFKVQTDCDIILLAPHMLEGEKLSQIAPPIEYVKAAQAVGREAGVPVIDMAARMKAKLAGRPWSSCISTAARPSIRTRMMRAIARGRSACWRGCRRNWRRVRVSSDAAGGGVNDLGRVLEAILFLIIILTRREPETARARHSCLPVGAYRQAFLPGDCRL